MDEVESTGAVTLARVEVVDLIGATLDPAYSLVDIVKLTVRAFGTEIIDEVEAGLADAAV